KAKQMQAEIWTRTSIEELQDRGMKLFNNGEYHRALDLFEQILEKDNNHVIAKSYVDECKTKLNKKIAEFFNSGMRLYTSGNYEGAIAEWNRILALDPNHESAIEYKNRAIERLEALEQLP
ncbi:tetratricopeptide repeat protein, partial [candidate division KSB1 bacterium]|nr:tetratricopeptide repeat protein [candidate division KSB1 bacterium]